MNAWWTLPGNYGKAPSACVPVGGSGSRPRTRPRATPGQRGGGAHAQTAAEPGSARPAGGAGRSARAQEAWRARVASGGRGPAAE